LDTKGRLADLQGRAMNDVQEMVDNVRNALRALSVPELDYQEVGDVLNGILAKLPTIKETLANERYQFADSLVQVETQYRQLQQHYFMNVQRAEEVMPSVAETFKALGQMTGNTADLVHQDRQTMINAIDERNNELEKSLDLVRNSIEQTMNLYA
jgi:hypothetical protein